jgi:hypothetical protein
LELSSKWKVVPYLPFYHVAKFSKSWSKIRVAFIIYKFGSVWKIENQLLVGRIDEQCSPHPFGLVPSLKHRPRPTGSDPGQGTRCRAWFHRSSSTPVYGRRRAGPGPPPSLSPSPIKRTTPAEASLSITFLPNIEVRTPHRSPPASRHWAIPRA